MHLVHFRLNTQLTPISEFGFVSRSFVKCTKIQISSGFVALELKVGDRPADGRRDRCNSFRHASPPRCRNNTSHYPLIFPIYSTNFPIYEFACKNLYKNLVTMLNQIFISLCYCRITLFCNLCERVQCSMHSIHKKHICLHL